MVMSAAINLEFVHLDRIIIFATGLCHFEAASYISGENELVLRSTIIIMI